MQYTTTGCPKCGYKTRNFESNVPSVQIGSPIVKCPNCGNIIIDRIATEYEFMTEKEREKFDSASLQANSVNGNIFLIIMGVILLIGGIALGEQYIFFGIIFGLGSVILGIRNMMHNSKVANEKMIEQCIYESLQRTTNEKYVKFIEKAYLECGIKRKFLAKADKGKYMLENNYFETRESYKETMKDFDDLMKCLEQVEFEGSKTTTITNP